MAEILETIMLVAFGLSWPINVYKNLKARTAKAMSLWFILLIISGYVAGITAKIMNNIFGFSCTAGIDNTKGDPKQKSIILEGNIFFLNKKSDLTLTVSPNILYAKVEDESFEDIEEVEGMATVADNRSLKDPAIFKGIIDESYLRGFLAASYTEKVEYDENSPINQFREMFGLNKQGKITSKVSMFANPYPFESALKFWGAVKGCGAQNPAKQQ